MANGIIVLIDSNNTLYRNYHTTPPKTVNGHRVESANGTLREAFKFQKKESVSKVVSFFDSNNTKNFRYDLDPDYKGTREGMPEDLQPQEELAQKGLRAAGFPVIVKEDFEADDAIGMVANKYASEGFDVVISTTDKDMMQLVTDQITIFNPITKKRIGIEGVVDKLGIRPDQVAEYLAIMGDKQDNIPGVDKVGPKTAVKLLEAHGSLQGIIEASGSVKGVVGERLREQAERLPLNLKLTTIESSPSHLTDEELSVLNDSPVDPIVCAELASEYGLVIGHLGEEAKKEPQKKPAVNDAEPSSQGSLF